MRPVVVVVGVLMLVLVATGSECAAPLDARVPCNDNADCPGTDLCLVDNFCGDPAVNCLEDVDCPAGLICLENGRCRANAECEVDADCCADAAVCSSTCTEFRCAGTECSAGDSEDCFVGCHRGARACDNGNWSLCDALPVVPAEVCGDGEDNDCNGEREEGCAACTMPLTQACETPCGPGTQDCQADGTFAPCDTVDGCLCVVGTDIARTLPCGFCGFRDSACGADGFWADDDVCQGEGECAVDDVEASACGCGVQSRTCDQSCRWGPLGACVVPDEACTPGVTETLSCGSCGSQTRLCGADCSFGTPTACVDDVGCALGEVQVQACGRCGEKSAVCDANCTFGAFGACEDEGVCSPGETETRECGDCGIQSRTCTSACVFSDFGDCEDEGECSPGDEIVETCGPATELGICEQGTRTIVCDENCRFPAAFCDDAVFASTEICGNGIDEDCNGADTTRPDQFEANDSCGTAFSLGTDPDGRVLQPTFDSIADDTDDYFFLNGVDNAGVFADEKVTAILSNMPTGMDLDLFLYKGLSACQSDAATSASQGTGSSETVGFEESFGTSDDDTFYIRVENFSTTASCFQPYTLTVTGLR